jgi:hypothetical protein
MDKEGWNRPESVTFTMSIMKRGDDGDVDDDADGTE